VFRASALALLLASTPAGGLGPIRCAGSAAPSLRDAASNLSVVRAATRRAARKEALRACRLALEALPLAAGGRVGDVGSGALAQQVHDILRGAREVGAPRFFADGGAALELEIRLTPELGALLAPPAAPLAAPR